MNFKLIGLVATALAVASAANATTFQFLFDNSGGGPDGTIATPFVGSGVFTTSATLTPGLYDLTSLPDYTLSYTFSDLDSYSTADIATPLSGLALNVTTFGAGLRMVWTETPGDPGADGGPAHGSLDLLNAFGILSFEPSYFGGHNLYYELGSAYSIGNYLATTTVVPEPATWAMMILGMGAIAAVLRRRREDALALSPSPLLMTHRR